MSIFGSCGMSTCQAPDANKRKIDWLIGWLIGWLTCLALSERVVRVKRHIVASLLHAASSARPSAVMVLPPFWWQNAQWQSSFISAGNLHFPPQRPHTMNRLPRPHASILIVASSNIFGVYQAKNERRQGHLKIKSLITTAGKSMPIFSEILQHSTSPCIEILSPRLRQSVNTLYLFTDSKIYSFMYNMQPLQALTNGKMKCSNVIKHR
jgi:hypothetical protein